MSVAGNTSIQLPRSLEREAERLAHEDGVSLEHWVSLAVAQKIGSVQSAAEFFKRRSNSVSIARMREILSMAPDVPPEPGDELSSGYNPRTTADSLRE